MCCRCFMGMVCIDTLLTSLAAGASIVCTPGCDVEQLLCMAHRPFDQPGTPPCPPCIKPFSPRLDSSREQAADYRLRFVRSASAPLPPTRLRGTGADLRDPRDRILRDDGDRFLAHRVQSAAAAPAQGRFGRRTGGSGRRDHGRRRGFAARRPDRAGCRSRRERHGRLRRRPNGDRRPLLPAIGSRPAISASSMTTGTCFSRAACGRSSIAAGRKSRHRKSTKYSWNIRRWRRP